MTKMTERNCAEHTLEQFTGKQGARLCGSLLRDEHPQPPRKKPAALCTQFKAAVDWKRTVLSPFCTTIAPPRHTLRKDGNEEYSFYTAYGEEFTPLHQAFYVRGVRGRRCQRVRENIGSLLTEPDPVAVAACGDGGSRRIASYFFSLEENQMLRGTLRQNSILEAQAGPVHTQRGDYWSLFIGAAA